MRFSPLFITLLGPLFAGCFGAVQGSGNVVEEERTVAPFREVSVASDFDVDIVVGKPQRVTLRFDDNLVDLVKVETVEGRLEIRQHEDINFFDTTEKSIRIEVPTMQAYVASGATRGTVFGIKSSRFDTVLSGDAEVTLEGEVTALDVSASGDAELDGSGLETKDVTVAASGSAEVRVLATQSVQGSLSGNAALTVYGDPELRRITTSGSADVDYR